MLAKRSRVGSYAVSGGVLIVEIAGGPSPASFLWVTWISYSVSGLRSTNEQLLRGVSNPGPQGSVPNSLTRTTEVTLGFQSGFQRSAELVGKRHVNHVFLPLKFGILRTARKLFVHRLVAAPELGSDLLGENTVQDEDGTQGNEKSA